MFGSILQVAIGGAIGSVARYLAVLATARLLGTGFPWGTLAVNVLGSVVMGALVVWLGTRGLMVYAPLLLVGVLGGFTTFSAFSLDAVRLWQEGATGAALLYCAGSVGLSMAGLVAGMALMKGQPG